MARLVRAAAAAAERTRLAPNPFTELARETRLAGPSTQHRPPRPRARSPSPHHRPPLQRPPARLCTVNTVPSAAALPAARRCHAWGRRASRRGSESERTALLSLPSAPLRGSGRPRAMLARRRQEAQLRASLSSPLRYTPRQNNPLGTGSRSPCHPSRPHSGLLAWIKPE